MKKLRVKSEELRVKAGAKPKMTADQKDLLAAAKSLDADVERAKEIAELSTFVRREMCKTCKNEGCKETGPNAKCILTSIASVVVGMLMEGGAK